MGPNLRDPTPKKTGYFMFIFNQCDLNYPLSIICALPEVKYYVWTETNIKILRGEISK